MISDLDIDYGVAVTTPYYQLQAADGSLGSHITAGFIHVVGGQYFLSQVDVGTARGVIFNCVEGFQASQYFYEPNGTFIGTGGANAITIKVTSDGSTAIQGARVNVLNGSVLIGNSATDASGNTSGISANNGTYTVTAVASNFQNYSGPITVSGAGSFTITMTANSAIPTPSLPNMCNVGGTMIDGSGNAVQGATGTFSLKYGPGKHRPLDAGGNAITTTEIQFTTDSGGNVKAANGTSQLAVIRTDGVFQADGSAANAYWLINCTALGIKGREQRLAVSTFDLGTISAP